jgi:hypothetical protein
MNQPLKNDNNIENSSNFIAGGMPFQTGMGAKIVLATPAR